MTRKTTSHLNERARRRFQSYHPNVEALEARDLLSVAPLLHVSANGRTLVDPNNQPFYMVGDSPWEMSTNITETEAAQYFQQRASQGFNTVILQAVNAVFTGSSEANPPADTSGDLPFAKLADGNFDLSKPNEAYWKHIDNLINLAAQNGIEVMLFPAFYGTKIFSGDYDWGTQFNDPANTANNNANIKAWGQFLGQRYVNSDNIIWAVGGDYNSLENSASDGQLASLLQGIQQFDTRHVVTMEGWDGVNSSAPRTAFTNSALRQYMSVDGVYVSGTRPFSSLFQQEYNRSDFGPTFMVESYYEGRTTPDDIRHEAYVEFLSGTTGYMFGVEGIWQFASGWQQQMNSVGTQEMTIFANLVKSLPWYNLVPDQNGSVFSGVSTSTDYVGEYAPDGSLAIAYKPSTGSGSQSFTVNMSKFSGPVTAKWFDPTNGTYTTIGTGLSNSGTQTFASPGTNSAGQNDFVLMLTASPSSTQAPNITSQPANATVNAGQSASFSVLANGTAPLTYQWQHLIGTNWTSVGTNAATLTISSSATSDGGSYRVTVTNSAGSVASNTATLTVNVAPVITSQPTSATVSVGQSASFTVSASGTAPLTYQWQHLIGSAWSNVGTNAAIFTIGSAATTDAGSYRAVVSNSAGSSTSSSAILTVNGTTAMVIGIAAGNSSVGSYVGDIDFSGGTVSGGTTNAINTSGIVNPAPMNVYQHGRYGNMTYTIPNLTPGATYTVRLHFAEYVWNAAGQRVFNVAINTSTVLSNFDIFAAAGGSNIAIAESFSAMASSTGNITIAFTTLVNNALVSGIEIDGSTTATSPSITTQPANQTVNLGQSATFGVTATGTAPLTYQWQHLVGSTWVNVGANTATLTIASATTSDVGNYRVLISNTAGTITSSSATLTVNMPVSAPSITSQPANATVTAGQSASFAAAASGTAPLSYQWQHLVGSTWANVGANSANLSIGAAASSDAGSYRVVVSNSGGSATSNSATLTVNAVTGSTVLAIAAGNSAIGSFLADTDFSGGSVSGGTTAIIDTSHVANPAPAGVYQHGRYGNMTYTIPNLTPGATYTVRLDFGEYYWSAAGQRVFNVAINGTQVLGNFDIFAAAGGKNIAVAQSFTATADASGKITISFTSLVDNAMVNGIEILS